MITAKATAPAVAFWAGLVFLLLAIMLAWFFLPTREWVQSFTAWAHEFGLLGVIIFSIGYIIAAILLAPTWPISVAAGLVFGALAFPIVVFSATVGAALAFLISRFLVRHRVRDLTRKRAVLEAIDKAVTYEGWKVVVLLRLSPLVPFNLQNYFLGATDIGFVPYLAATFFGIMPGAAAYVYLGTLGRVAASADKADVKIALLVAGLAATVVLIFVVGRKAKAKLESLGVDKGGP